MDRAKTILIAGGLAAGLVAAVPARAAANDGPCAGHAAPAKKKGLGGLFSAAKNAGFGLGGKAGTIAGAVAGTAEALNNVATECGEGAGESSDGGTNGKSNMAADAAPKQARYFSDIVKPADVDEKRRAFDDFSAYPCSDCEGGKGYDSWIKTALYPRFKEDRSFDRAVGEMKVGEVLRWKGERATGTLTVVSEEPVQGMPCKSVQYRLEKGAQSAERMGLFCFGKGASYYVNPYWQEIY